MRSMNLTKLMPRSLALGGGSLYITGPTLYLQKCFWKSAKEKEADKACQKSRDETKSIKEQAERVKVATQSIQDLTTSTTDSVTNMTKEVRKEIHKTTDTLCEKIKEPIEGAVTQVWDKAASNIEDKVAEKIKDRVLQKANEPDNDTNSHKPT